MGDGGSAGAEGVYLVSVEVDGSGVDEAEEMGEDGGLRGVQGDLNRCVRLC